MLILKQMENEFVVGTFFKDTCTCIRIYRAKWKGFHLILFLLVEKPYYGCENSYFYRHWTALNL